MEFIGNQSDPGFASVVKPYLQESEVGLRGKVILGTMQGESIVDRADRVAYNQYVRGDCDLDRLIIRISASRLLAELYE